MLHQLSIGLSGMKAAQVGLDVSGNNLANANTPGFRRQRLMLSSRDATPWVNLLLGNGVDVDQVRQTRADLIGRQLLDNLGKAAETQAQYDVSTQIESRLNPASGSLGDQFDQFHSAMEAMTAAPYNLALRNQSVQAGLTLTRQVNRIAADLISLDRTIQGRIEDGIEQVNTLADQIRELNSQIKRLENGNSVPNTLIDQRNALAEELAELVHVEVDERTQQVFMGGLVIGTQIPQRIAYDGENVVVEGTDAVIEVGGMIGGLQKASAEILPRARQRLDEFAFQLASSLDSLHYRGVGLGGSLKSVESQRAVEDVTGPLIDSTSPFEVRSGFVYMGVTNEGTGERTLHAISFDPVNESVTDLAAKLNSATGVESSVTDRGKLVIRASSGYGFDFTGRPSTSPDTSGLTGTSTPTLSGRHEGANRNVTFEFLGSGDIGVTPGLQLSVTDSVTGESLGTFDIGQGYAPGDSIELPDGVSFQLSVGTVVAGESFSADLISEADTTGSLVRLGVNTLFEGSNAADITINASLLDDASRLAASLSGEPGDSSNLIDILASRANAFTEGSSETIDDTLFTATGFIGHESNSLATELEGLTLVGDQLFVERESVEGVNPNEELVELMKYQRAFEASARFVTIVNQTLDELFSIAR